MLRQIESLIFREEQLYSRFIEDVEGEPWTPHILDLTASYIALAHAECEEVLEQTVGGLVAHSVECCKHGHAHPAAVNLVVHLNSKLQLATGVNYVGSRKELETDASRLSGYLQDLRMVEHWKNSVEKNHGTGTRYIESLMQPFGVKLDRASFARLEGAGVREIMRLPSTFRTDLLEFTHLRGRAVHTSRSTFADKVRGSSPADVRKSARRGIEAIVQLCTTVTKRLW